MRHREEHENENGEMKKENETQTMNLQSQSEVDCATQGVGRTSFPHQRSLNTYSVAAQREENTWQLSLDNSRLIKGK